MYDLRFKQMALNKLDLIYAQKKSMDDWLKFWAEKECPVQVGDKYPVWISADPIPQAKMSSSSSSSSSSTEYNMVVSKITAKLVGDRKFVWWIEGWVTIFKSKELHTDIFEMEKDNEK